MGDKDVHAFSKDIIQKLNVIEWLAFKFAYYNVVVQYIDKIATRYLLPIIYGGWGEQRTTMGLFAC